MSLHVELLDSDTAEPDAAAIGHGRGWAPLVAIAFAVFALGWALGSVSSNDEPSAADDSVLPSPDSPPVRDDGTSAQSPATDEPIFVPWPDPPDDHDPHVISIPGAGIAILGERTDLTLVYVNSLGRPTVVDLDTGRTSELLLAATRSVDRFAVEFGAVVSADGSSANLPAAGERAAIFFAHNPDVVESFSGARSDLAPGPGAHLCLSPSGCETLSWQTRVLVDGADSLVAVGPGQTPVIAEILYGDRWERRGRYLVDPDDVESERRVPAPLGDEAWLLHQPAA